MGHRGRHPILAQALHRFIDYPALYLDIVYVHTPLSCYIIAHVSKLHTQAPVNLEFWYIVIATIYKPSHRVKKLMGHGSTPSDPWPIWHIRFSWPILPMTHDPSTHSLLCCVQLLVWKTRVGGYPRHRGDGCRKALAVLHQCVRLPVSFSSLFYIVIVSCI